MSNNRGHTCILHFPSLQMTGPLLLLRFRANGLRQAIVPPTLLECHEANSVQLSPRRVKRIRIMNEQSRERCCDSRGVHTPCQRAAAVWRYCVGPIRYLKVWLADERRRELRTRNYRHKETGSVDIKLLTVSVRDLLLHAKTSKY